MSDRIAVCKDFCRRHGTALYRRDDVYYIVFKSVRDSVPFADEVIDIGFPDGVYCEFDVFAICESVLKTMEGMERVL